MSKVAQKNDSFLIRKRLKSSLGKKNLKKVDFFLQKWKNFSNFIELKIEGEIIKFNLAFDEEKEDNFPWVI